MSILPTHLFSDELFLILDSEDRVLEAGPNAVRLLGPGLAGKKIQELVAPEAHAVFEKALRSDEPHPEEFEAILQLPSGRALCRWKINKTDKVYVIARDLTTELRQRHKQQLMLGRLDLVLSTMQMGTWELNDIRKELIWDDRMYALYGLKRENFATPHDLYNAAYAAIDHNQGSVATEELERAKEAGQEIHSRYQVRSKDGRVRHLRVFGRPVQNKSERTYFGVVWDETESILKAQQQKQVEAKMLASAKMVALGEMSGGVAHEINNPLNVIQARAFQLQQLAESPPVDAGKLAVAAESISRTADKIARIVRSLRTFAREGDSDAAETIPVHQLIDEVLELTQLRFLNAGIDMRVRPVPPELAFESRHVEIAQALMGLLNNSFEAVRGLSERWIEIAVTDLGRDFEISVTDSGAGISRKIAEKMFEPFFTTREVGHGMGLGLSTASGAVKSHGGDLSYDETSPHTRFVMRLPKRQ